MTLGIIVQARSNSTRLPGKIFKQFYKDKGILELLLLKLKYLKKNIPIIVATSTHINDDKVEVMAKSMDVFCYRGDQDDVLSRFIDVCEIYNIDRVIRICADNPFLDMEYLNQLIDEADSDIYDYISFQTALGIPTIKTHFGFWAESISRTSLEMIKTYTLESVYLEHVTNFIYTNEDIFSCKFLPIPNYIEKSEIRMTLDTIEDFNLLKEIYHKFIKEKKQDLETLVKLVINNDKWLKVMKAQIIRNSK